MGYAAAGACPGAGRAGRVEAAATPSAAPLPIPACNPSTGPSCCRPSSRWPCFSRTSRRRGPLPPSWTSSPTPTAPRAQGDRRRRCRGRALADGALRARPSRPQIAPGRCSTKVDLVYESARVAVLLGRIHQAQGTPTRPRRFRPLRRRLRSHRGGPRRDQRPRTFPSLLRRVCLSVGEVVLAVLARMRDGTASRADARTLSGSQRGGRQVVGVTSLARAVRLRT